MHSASTMAPEPDPKSRILPLKVGPSFSIKSSTSLSVSGRGIKARESHFKDRLQNSTVLMMCCNGTLFPRSFIKLLMVERSSSAQNLHGTNRALGRGLPET